LNLLLVLPGRRAVTVEFISDSTDLTPQSTAGGICIRSHCRSSAS